MKQILVPFVCLKQVIHIYPFLRIYLTGDLDLIVYIYNSEARAWLPPLISDPVQLVTVHSGDLCSPCSDVKMSVCKRSNEGFWNVLDLFCKLFPPAER